MSNTRMNELELTRKIVKVPSRGWMCCTFAYKLNCLIVLYFVKFNVLALNLQSCVRFIFLVMYSFGHLFSNKPIRNEDIFGGIIK